MVNLSGSGDSRSDRGKEAGDGDSSNPVDAARRDPGGFGDPVRLGPGADLADGVPPGAPGGRLVVGPGDGPGLGRGELLRPGGRRRPDPRRPAGRGDPSGADLDQRAGRDRDPGPHRRRLRDPPGRPADRGPALRLARAADRRRRRPARWPDVRRGARPDAPGQPRPDRPTVRDPLGPGRHPDRQPPGQPDLLCRQPARPLRRVHQAAPRRPDPVRRQHLAPDRLLRQAEGPDRRRRPGEPGHRGAVPGRRPAPDRQPRQRLPRRARGQGDRPLRRDRPEGVRQRDRGDPPLVRAGRPDQRRPRPDRGPARGVVGRPARRPGRAPEGEAGPRRPP